MLFSSARNHVVFFSLAGLLSLAAVSGASAQDYTILNPGQYKQETGTEYAAVAGQWWDWAFSQPEEVNPVLDTTGEYCAQGQEGDLWFLAGTFTGESISRACTVAADKVVVFPVLNNAYFAFPEDGETGKQVRATVAGTKQDITALEVSIDGEPVDGLQRYFQKSDIFSLSLDEDSLFGEIELSPCADQAVYLGVEFAPGEHTVQFYAILESEEFGTTVIDVTYTLIVEG